jgi:hypothetical protein
MGKAILPSAGLLRQVNTALLSLIIETTALTKQYFSNNYGELQQMAETSKPKKVKQKIIRDSE